MKKSQDKLKNFAANTSGSVALEFAITFPVFLSLLLLIISASLFGIAKSNLQEKVTGLSLEFSDFSNAAGTQISAPIIRAKLVALSASPTGADLNDLSVVETSQSTNAFKIFRISQSHQVFPTTLGLPQFDFFNHISFLMYVPIDQSSSDD